MKQYEIKIEILDKDYIDSLIVSLVRQGYEVYLNKEDNAVYFTIVEKHLQIIQE